jgi:hypothetical protein
MNVDMIRRTLKVLLEPGSVAELRVPKTKRGTKSGYYNNREMLAHDAVRLSDTLDGGAEGVYMTLNPVYPTLLARADNQWEDYARHTTKDDEIVRRHWLLIDCDPVRPAGISSTDAEHEAALARARSIRDWLQTLGWPEPIFADSGNGAHVLSRIDLSNDTHSTNLIARVLSAVNLRFGDDVVTVDTTTHNASRLVKLYGTRTTKGSSTEERPHRLSRLLEEPSELVPVAREQLEAVAAMVPEKPRKDRSNTGRFDLAGWIEEHSLEVAKEGNWDGDGRKYVLATCPWNPEHTDRAAYIVQFSNGAIAAGCHHNGCSGKDWYALRDTLESSWREAHGQSRNGDGPQRERENQATRLVQMALEAGVELWHDPEGDAWVTIPVLGHYEHRRVTSRAFKLWLQRLFYEQEERAAGSQGVTDALGILQARALFDGPQHMTHVRVASHEYKIYLDLADEEWRVVEIDADGWRVVDRPSVRFRRPSGILPLPEPVRGGSLDELRPFLTVSDEDWNLWVINKLHDLQPSGPYVVKIFRGPPGSGKSTTSKVDRSLIDPSIAPLRRRIREERDIAIAANNNWICAFDNVSSIPQWLSDTLCSLTTGSGFATRALYTNDEETLFNAQRPIILNGIGDVAVKSDLLDRAVIYDLQRPASVWEEEDLWPEFKQAHPRILGALLDALVETIRRRPQMRVRSDLRMADFVRTGRAAAPAVGWTEEQFVARYARACEETSVVAREGASYLTYVHRYVKEQPNWELDTTWGDLYAAIHALAPDSVRRSRSWPSNEQVLSRWIRGLEHNLVSGGWTVRFDDKARLRRLMLRAPDEDGADRNKPASDHERSPSQSVASASESDSNATGFHSRTNAAPSHPSQPSQYYQPNLVARRPTYKVGNRTIVTSNPPATHDERARAEPETEAE